MKQILLVLLSSAAIGCASGAPVSQTGAAGPGGTGSDDVAEATAAGDVAQAGAGEEEDPSTEDLAAHHRHHSHGGFAMFIAMSLDSLNTTPEQKAQIDKIRADLHAKMQPAHDAERAVLLAIADGVAAGQVDPAKLDPQIAQVTTAAAGIHDAVVASLNELHETLTPAQRQALVDKLEAHLEVWHHANTHDAEHGDKHAGYLGRLAKDLTLTPQQVAAIREGFASTMKNTHFDRAEADAHVKSFGAAFASDHFDAKTHAAAGPLNGKMATWGITRTVRFYQAVTAQLTPEQRTKLADDIRRHANYQRSEGSR